MAGPADLVQAELARASAAVADLQLEYDALADPDNVALDDEHDSEGSTIGFERARVGGLLEAARLLVADLQAAAARVAEDAYDKCVSCGQDIGSERLAALPATQICIDCARRPSFELRPGTG